MIIAWYFFRANPKPFESESLEMGSRYQRFLNCPGDSNEKPRFRINSRSLDNCRMKKGGIDTLLLDTEESHN